MEGGLGRCAGRCKSEVVDLGSFDNSVTTVVCEDDESIADDALDSFSIGVVMS